MAKTELQLQQGLQTILRSLDEFVDESVVINNWRILDQPNSEAPYAIIVTADTFDSTQPTVTAIDNYDVPIILAVKFWEWPDALNEFRDLRQSLLSTFNTSGTARSLGGLESVTVDRIRSNGPITPYYDRFLSAEQQGVADPVFLTQEIILEVRQF